MMSWQPRMIDRNEFSRGPRNWCEPSESCEPVRMWNDSGKPSSIAFSQSGFQSG